MFHILFFNIINLCVGITTKRAPTFQSSNGTPLSWVLIHPVSSSGQPQLLILHYEYSEYSPFNTYLLLVTHGITIHFKQHHSLYFEFSIALEIFSICWDQKSGLKGRIYWKPQLYFWANLPSTTFLMFDDFANIFCIVYFLKL